MSAEDRNGKVSSEEEYTPRERSFDELTKGLASASVSRRGALRLLAGALLGGALASTGLGRIGDSNGEAQAQVGAPGGSTCSNQGESCKAQKCCQGLTCIGESGNRVCCPKTRACGSLCCATGQTCVANSVCSGCPGGQTACASPTLPTGACVDLQTDVLNCGACGTKCVTGQGCCGGTCTDLNTILNCGACNNACTAPANAQAVCVGGSCDFVCNPGFRKIGNECCPEARVCGTQCLATACDAAQCQVCDPTSSTCISLCGSGQGCCGGGTCTDLNTVTNCGACNNACTAPTNAQAVCVGGSCDFVCNPGFEEVNGACQTACGAGQTLCKGQCVTDCTGARTLNQSTCTCQCPASNPRDCGGRGCCTGTNCGGNRGTCI